MSVAFLEFLHVHVLTHSYLDARKRVIGKQCRPRSDAISVASDQALHCLLTGFSINPKQNYRYKIDPKPLK